MNRPEFSAALDRYGADLSRWPPRTAEEAGRLVASDDEAAVRLAEARRLDELLTAAVQPAPVDAVLVGRIVAGRQPGERRGNGLQLRPTPRLGAVASLAMAVALIIGFTAGYLIVPDDSEDAIASLVFGATDEDAGDWL